MLVVPAMTTMMVSRRRALTGRRSHAGTCGRRGLRGWALRESWHSQGSGEERSGHQGNGTLHISLLFLSFSFYGGRFQPPTSHLDRLTLC